MLPELSDRQIALLFSSKMLPTISMLLGTVIALAFFVKLFEAITFPVPSDTWKEDIEKAQLLSVKTLSEIKLLLELVRRILLVM